MADTTCNLRMIFDATRAVELLQRLGYWQIGEHNKSRHSAEQSAKASTTPSGSSETLLTSRIFRYSTLSDSQSAARISGADTSTSSNWISHDTVYTHHTCINSAIPGTVIYNANAVQAITQGVSTLWITLNTPYDDWVNQLWTIHDLRCTQTQ
jgi:hypothetical protein